MRLCMSADLQNILFVDTLLRQNKYFKNVLCEVKLNLQNLHTINCTLPCRVNIKC